MLSRLKYARTTNIKIYNNEYIQLNGHKETENEKEENEHVKDGNVRLVVHKGQ